MAKIINNKNKNNNLNNNINNSNNYNNKRVSTGRNKLKKIKNSQNYLLLLSNIINNIAEMMFRL